ncbi:MAG: LPS export ABC transporter periplasmic protein LptC [Armatimonadetes bacterium]|nr:LPS export ABC transporter periplasmic protein LptC [Armatimonadota bacterium]
MMNRRSIILCFCCFFCAAARLLAQPIGPAQPVTFSADSSRATSGAGGASLVWTLMGNVRILQGTTTITADKGTWYESAQQGVLTGKVRIVQPGNTLTATQVEYNGISKVAVASGGVTIVDTGATIKSATAEYDMGRRVAQFGGGVTVLDSGATITSASLNYDLSQRIARFRGGVTLRDSNSTLRAAEGEYYSATMKADFRGNVVVTNDSGTIHADNLTHWRATQESFAVGNVKVDARYQRTQMFGDTIHAFPQRNYTVATGNPRLVKIDSVSIAPETSNSATTNLPPDSLPANGFRYDTTVITSRAMEAYRGEQEEYRATGNVMLTRGTLQAVGQIARLLNNRELITLGSGRKQAVVDSAASSDSATNSATPDTASAPVTGAPRPDTTAAATAAGSLAVSFPDPIIWYDKSQITGDTITIGMAEQRLQWIEVWREAFAISEGKIPQRLDQLRGNRMLFTVRLDTIREVRSEGEAASIYFNYDREHPDGVVRAVCDTMVITFDAGQAAEVETIGGQRLSDWEVVPEQNVAGVESSYRLEGFRRYDRLGGIAQNAGQQQTNSVVIPSKPIERQVEKQSTEEASQKRR